MLRTETLHYEADGPKIGYLAYDETREGRRPGVLLFPDGLGLGPHAKTYAERIAGELGYVALACDLHGEGRLYDQLAEVPDLLPFHADVARVRAHTTGSLSALCARPEVDPGRIAAIGFCGNLQFELALTGADLRAVVGFHSNPKFTSPGDAGKIKGHVLALFGADDPFIPVEDRNAFEALMRDAGVEWQMSLYGKVVHRFTAKDAARLGLPDAVRYDEVADRRSWKAMRDLFEEVMA